MGSGLIKNIVISIILVVLAFVVGSMAADGARDSIMVLGGIVGAFLLLYMGKNCWWLIFLVPPLVSFLPLGILRSLPLHYSLSAVVLVYWLVLRAMGYVRVVWHGVVWMDLITFVFFAYLAYTFYAHPVELMMFSGTDAEYVGGKEYLFALAALACYLSLSIIPCTLDQLNKVLRYTFLIQIGLVVLVLAWKRLGGLGSLGGFLYMTLACKYSLWGLIMAPWRLIILVLALSFTLYGQREVLLGAAGTYLGISLVKKQLTLLTLMGGAAYGLLMYCSSENLLILLPERIQRTLYIVPWINIDKQVAQAAQHSSDWRKEMWRWAMDPRTRYIKDYTWGDGFGQSMKGLRLTTINLNRGRVSGGDQERFAEAGVWHSGIFTAIHRIGFVGLGLMTLWFGAGALLIVRVCMALERRKQGFYIMFYTMSFFGKIFVYYISAGTFMFFFNTFYYVAVAKIAYSEALKTGLMAPMFSRPRYVPMVYREAESAAAQPR